MSDRPRMTLVDIHSLRTRVSWLFYGTRTYADLDANSKETVNDIINDGYERFLNPPAAPGERRPHRWGFLRPYFSFVTVADQEDYGLPSDFGGVDGSLYYQRSDGKVHSIAKTDPSRIQYLRQRDSISLTGCPSEYAIVTDYPSGLEQASNIIMFWPTPDAAYTLKVRYFIIAQLLSDNNPYPACDAYHNQTLIESCLAVAEERLEDQQSLHTTNFMQRLASSVAHDREKYSPDHMSMDMDRSDNYTQMHDYHIAGGYTSYNGYVPGS